jgi:hypothetical protein
MVPPEPRTVVDVEVVGCLGEESGDLGQLAAVLREVRLPEAPPPGLLGRQPEQVRAA